ncbi:MAG: hypothetical protein ABFD63_13490 [Smithella sp.]
MVIFNATEKIKVWILIVRLERVHDYARMERPEDISHIHIINAQAFNHPSEANIVDKRLQSCPHCLSLVAEEDRP